MLTSNVPNNLMKDILSLVPDALDNSKEFWRIVPNTAEGWTYSVSSCRDLLVAHAHKDSLGRIQRPHLLNMLWDSGCYNTSIRRSSKQYSTYIEHVRYDAFPELNKVKTLDNDNSDAIDVPYEGVVWHGRNKQRVHIIPVSTSDMHQVRLFYSEDLPREIWAYVPGTNRKYVISSQCRGVILKRYRVDGGILKPQIWQLKSSKKNYYECCLTVGDHQLNSVSHQHVLRSFIPCPGDDYEVNHIDGDTHNNILDNLEWVTRQENSDHYNKSPEMAEKRAIGYKHISEWGKLHQKEIQNKPEVNDKRSKSLSRSWTSDRKKAQSEYSKSVWINSTPEQKARRTQGLMNYNATRHSQSL